ncbi:flagellar hook-length control protein FliK [Pelagibacterium luteolum]|uniref:Hook-length control protein FliK n=1 Tax=Pelagibacterium luteolum TaxID=440168 RepID=A0A1G7V2J2_9HYPH|nr:flagellar hook-length control protein FliK [Pelagibacterium luteolum]SDG53731.1 hook-length control protein FliK [Pelagibacterium luteolum]
MTTAIGMPGNIIASTSQQGANRASSGAVEGFVDLLNATLGTTSAARHIIGGAQAAPTLTPPTEGEAELATLLGELLGRLEALGTRLEDDAPLDASALKDLEDLLAGISDLLGEDIPLPGPNAPIFARVADLAAQLGLGASGDDGATGPLDRLSQILAKLADGVRKDAPDLAAGLTAMTKTLDAQSAALLKAQSEAASAAINPRQIESETKLNPLTAIAAADPAADAADPVTARTQAEQRNTTDTAEGSERTLVKSDAATQPAGNAANQNGAGSQNQNGTGAGASTAPTPAELDAPDGLITPAGQTATQSVGATTPGARPEAAAYQRPDAQINLPHIAAEISRHVQNGINRFEIRLNPSELGRIDVRMEMDTSGNVIARLAVERSETLDLLQRDQRALMAALEDAGIDPGKTNLEFSLNQEGGNAWDDGEKPGWSHDTVANLNIDASITATNADPNPYMRGYARLDAVNLWV